MDVVLDLQYSGRQICTDLQSSSLSWGKSLKVAQKRKAMNEKHNPGVKNQIICLTNHAVCGYFQYLLRTCKSTADEDEIPSYFANSNNFRSLARLSLLTVKENVVIGRKIYHQSW